jgi:arabinan endo-1,5-alpha-L-arabinosidase
MKRTSPEREAIGSPRDFGANGIAADYCSRNQRVSLRLLGLVATAVVVSVFTAQPSFGAGPSPTDRSWGQSEFYQNPLQLQTPIGLAQECPDPNVIKGQAPDDHYWYLYSTSGPLTNADRDAQGNLITHFIPMYRSLDLVRWEYQGDAFAGPPSYAAPGAHLWAPDVRYFNGKYYLYYVVTATTFPSGGSAIGVATSAQPTGPWVPANQPAVEPHPGPGTNGAPRSCFDPEIVFTPDGKQYVFFGSYFGGVAARTLSADGLSSDPTSEVQITIPNRYEGVNVVQHDGYYYLLGSATNCCDGPLTGYAVFAGRSTDPLGPYVDRDGNLLLSGRVGGTPVLTQNGNRWVGPGGEYTIHDFAGQDWLVYHAIDENDPFFTNPDGSVQNTVDTQKRPVLIDRLDWIDGWPIVRGGRGPSDTAQFAPAAQPGEKGPGIPDFPVPSWLDNPIQTFWFDNFSGNQLNPAWSWVRPPDPSTYQVSNNQFSFQTQNGDIFFTPGTASVLTRQLPPGDCVIETRVSVNVPPEGCCHNFVQGGLVFYGGDSNFIKLAVVSIWETRQTEYAKKIEPQPPGYPHYGNTVIGTPSDRTTLRIVRRVSGDQEYYTGYTAVPGKGWVRGGTWTHKLGQNATIGLVSMGGAGFVSQFDYVWVYKPVPAPEWVFQVVKP